MSGYSNSQNSSKNKILLIGFIILGCLFFNGCGEKEPKVVQIGVLHGMIYSENFFEGFKAGMNEQGYIEGKNITYNIKTPKKPGDEELLLDQFMKDKIDLVWTYSTRNAKICKTFAEKTGIPAIFSMANVEGTGLIGSVRQPGGNITGSRSPGPDLSAKRLEIFSSLFPSLKRVYLAYNKKYPTIPPTLMAVRDAAQKLGLILVEDPLDDIQDFEKKLNAHSASEEIGFDGILIMPENLTQAPTGWKMLGQFAAKHKIPIAGNLPFQVNRGALFTYFPDFFDFGKLTAPLANKIINGISAGTIPVVTAEANLRINYKVAQGLGLTVPDDLLSQAKEIIR